MQTHGKARAFYRKDSRPHDAQRDVLFEKASKDGDDECLQICQPSREIGPQNSDIQLEEKMRQLLWETSPELKELRKKIQIAHMAKDQAVQLEEKKAMIKLKKEEEKYFGEILDRQKEEMEKELIVKELEELKVKKKYHQDLDEFGKYKREKELSEKKLNQEEKDKIDEIKKQIQEDMRAERKKVEQNQKEYQKQIKEFLDIRNEIKLAEKLSADLQDMKCDEYHQVQVLRMKEEEAKRILLMKQKLRRQEELLKCLDNTIRDKKKQEALKMEIAIAEKEAREMKLQEEKTKHRLHNQNELQRNYEMQIYIKRKQRDAEKREEELLRQKLIAKYQEEEKMELLSHEKRKQKQIEHAHKAQIVIDNNREKKNHERRIEIELENYNKQNQSQRQKMIQEEKVNFLKEQAPELLGYLPKGMFPDYKTIDQLGDEVKKFYGRK